LIKSPKLKFHDIGYIRHDNDTVSLELYSAGNAIETITIDHLICVSNGCMSKSHFNEEYLNKKYPNNLMKNLLMRKPIFNKTGYQKEENGFSQKIQTKDYSIIYKVHNNQLYFKDSKNHIILKLKDIDE